MSRGKYTFRIHLWGVTGTFASPLAPPEIEQKLLDCVTYLLEQKAFHQAAPQLAADPAALRKFLVEHLPFHLRSTYGGNTTCLEIQAPDALMIVDSGSGFRRLGDDLSRRWNNDGDNGRREAHVLLTHAHMDHTFATPFIDPYYDARNSFHIWGPRKVIKSLHAVLSPRSRLRNIYFPATYELLIGIKQFTAIYPGKSFAIASTEVQTFGLNHPGGSLAYRFNCGERSFVVATDHEHSEVPDQGLAEFARGADVLYADAQYLQDEYEGHTGIADERPASRKGWGHSTVEAVVETAVLARVRHLLLGHHEPKRSDERLAALESYARQRLAAALARENLAADSCRVDCAREDQILEL